jgi:hypothetical protein
MFVGSGAALVAAGVAWSWTTDEFEHGELGCGSALIGVGGSILFLMLLALL